MRKSQKLVTTSRPHISAWRAGLRVLGVLFVLAGLLITGLPVAAQDSGGSTVYVAKIEGTIDLGLAPFLQRVIDDAEDDSTAAVIVEINTPGGRLDAVLQMRDTLLGADVRTIAFVNRDAFSAGALIAIACEEIYMAPGGVMGAATPVDGAGETASDKVVSAVRKTFKSTAEERGRDPAIAEAMVDPSVEVEGLDGPDTLLTLTTAEALEWGYADGTAANRSELLAATGLEGATVNEMSPSLAERMVRFLTNPIVASLLFSFGLLLIIGDALIGGVGIVAVIGVAMVALFFWGYFLAGLAGWEGVALVMLGLVLVAVEAFVIPGFGVAGVGGVVSLLAGLYLTLAGGVLRTDEDTWRAVTGTSIALLVLILGAFVFLLLLPRLSGMGGLVLQTRLGQEDAPKARRGILGWLRKRSRATELPVEQPTDQSSDPRPASLIGVRGVALSDLRPAGIATVEGQRIDVVSEGGYISAGAAVVIVRDDGYRRVVQEISQEADLPDTNEGKGESA